jgi:orotidine-5'-phosphate decarboxylase
MNTPTVNDAKSKLIVALDLPDMEKAIAMAKQLQNHVGVFKIGLQLFLKEGRKIVENIAEFGVPIFLDLKLHDIPATVSKAIASLDNLPISMLTVHTAGGKSMLEAAAIAARKLSSKPLVLGVTVLTSIGDEDIPQLGMSGKISEIVLKRAKLAYESGLGGIVASASELETLRPALPSPFKLVIPGIRPQGAELFDQKRVATPSIAISQGADFLVIGRPIRDAQNPLEASNSIVNEIFTTISGVNNEK